MGHRAAAACLSCVESCWLAARRSTRARTISPRFWSCPVKGVARQAASCWLVTACPDQCTSAAAASPAAAAAPPASAGAALMGPYSCALHSIHGD